MVPCAIIKDKLLCGLETVHLTQPVQKKVNAFQLRGLQKTLGMDTKYECKSHSLRQISYQPDSAQTFHIGKRRVGGRRKMGCSTRTSSCPFAHMPTQTGKISTCRSTQSTAIFEAASRSHHHANRGRRLYGNQKIAALQHLRKEASTVILINAAMCKRLAPKSRLVRDQRPWEPWAVFPKTSRRLARPARAVSTSFDPKAYMMQIANATVAS